MFRGSLRVHWIITGSNLLKWSYVGTFPIGNPVVGIYTEPLSEPTERQASNP